jgi:alpha-ketoglutarate-dependent taurine dioxygenase
MITETRKPQYPSPSSRNRKSVKLSISTLIDARTLFEDRPLPLLVTPTSEEVDLSTWVSANRDTINSLLKKHGALLFRGFGTDEQADFERFLDAMLLRRMHYKEGATPRSELGNQVYTSTEFPPEHRIALHNELSYVLTWPMKISFFCVVPPAERGETPIADMRRVYQRIPEAIRENFARKGWMLQRNFGDGLGLPWQTAFRTSSKEEVERYCREAMISCHWSDGERLRTRQVRPAIAVHPETGEPVWFNHIAFWHVSSLDPGTRKMLVAEFTEHGIPYNTYYGDGSAIEDSVIDELRQAYDAETIHFPWQQGDVLFLDNMLVSHGRNPFTPPRKIIVAMGDPFTRNEKVALD